MIVAFKPLGLGMALQHGKRTFLLWFNYHLSLLKSLKNFNCI